MNKIFLILISFSLSSCASYFLRKECEKTNWFEHGKKIATAGKYINEDAFVQSCFKAEGEVSSSELDKGFKAGREWYCSKEGAEKTGGDGQPFNFKMCADFDSSIKLEGPYQKGIAKFCTPENGYSVGLRGEKYLKVCPQKTEPKFLVQYNKGLRIYYDGKITAAKEKRERLRDDLRSAQLQAHSANLRYQSVESSYQSDLNRYNTMVKVGYAATQPDDSELQSARRQASSAEDQVNSIGRSIRALDDELDQLTESRRALGD